MRIAIYHDLPSGGAKRATYEIAKYLSLHHTVDVYTLTTSEHDFCDLRPVVTNYYIFDFQPLPLYKSPLGRLNQFQRWRDLKRLNAAGKQVAARIDAANYDVVLVHPSMWTQAPAVLSALRTPTVYYVHEALRKAYEPSIPRPYEGNGWRTILDRFDPLIYLYEHGLRAVDRRNTRAATVLLTNSRFTAESIREIYDRTALVCYLGVDLEQFRPLSGVVPKNFVLSVGALRPNKGFDFLISALAQIPQATRPGLQVVANADNHLERSYLAALAQKLVVDLRFEIGISEATLVQRYNEARLVLYAPVREPFGFVPLEALACGKLVLGVSEGGLLESISLPECLVERDVKAFSQKLTRFLEDQSLTYHLGQQARTEIVEYWGWEKAAARVEEQLRQVCRN